MVPKKRKSKRQTLAKKYKIERRVKEHKKKLKKGALNNPTRRKKIVDKNIPNAWPFKEDLLREIAVAKEKMEAKKLALKQRKLNTASSSGQPSSEEPTAVEMDVTAAASEPFADASDDEEAAGAMADASLGQNSRRAFLKELRSVIRRADVLLLVLDARDPLGTRSRAVEAMIEQASGAPKKLVYILNKADLVPRDALQGWLSYLRQFHPTLPFKCNTQRQKEHLSRATGSVADNGHLLSSQRSQAIGAEELLGLLKNYCRVSGDHGRSKSIITVGVVGFPNVGKSSLLNSLLRSRAVGVSATPGSTKTAQEVILDHNIRLLDCPGVVFADDKDPAATALRNCVQVESLSDVFTPIEGILAKCPAAYLMQLYHLRRFEDGNVTSFLAAVAQALGKLKKGGVPNLEAAAKAVLHDWNHGVIKYYCRPPAPAASAAQATDDAAGAASLAPKYAAETQLLTEFSPALDVDALRQAEISILRELYPQDAPQAKDVHGSEFVFADFVGVDGAAEEMVIDQE